VLRAVVSGYQSLRRLSPEEAGSLWTALRFAAGREGARRAGMRRPEALAPLKAVDALGETEVRAAAGA
jgi:Ser/Thr protein kinase RdoA (MazF antagonist)